MPDFKIEFEAIDQASPTIKKLSEEMIKAAKKSDRFADEIVRSSRRVDTGLKKIPPAAKKASTSMDTLKQASGQLQSQLFQFASVAGVVALFKSAAQAALDEEEAVRRLAFAVNATGASFESAKDKINAFANAQQALTRFDDTATFEALSKILRVTGDVDQAIKATALAQDIASASGRDLNFVTEKLNELLIGEQGALLTLKKEYGAFIGDARTTQEALDGLAKGFAGAAEAEQSHTKSLQQNIAFLGDFSQKVGEGVLPVVNGLFRAINFVAKGFEQLGETIGFLAAQQFTALVGSFQAFRAAIRGDFAAVQSIVKDSLTKSKAITEEFAQGITDIEERFSGKRVQIASDEAKLKSKISTVEADKAKNAAAARAKAEEDFLKKVESLNTSLLALRGQSLDAELARIRTEQDAKLKALEDVFEKTNKSEELQAKLRDARVLHEEETARRIAEVRDKGINDFNEKVKQSELELLDVRGQSFEAERDRITAERDAKLEALDESFEATRQTAEQEAQLIEAQNNIRAAAEEKLTKARLENLDEFEKAAEQVTQKMADELSDAVTDMITEGKTFEDAWKSVMDSVLKTAIKTFTRVAIEAAISRNAASGVAGGFGGAGAAIGIGVIGGALPKILKGIKFAEGGIVRQPTVGIVGEAGPEAVIPLNKPNGIGNNVQITVKQSNTINVTGIGRDQVREIMRGISEATRDGGAEAAELVKSVISKQNRFLNEAV